MAKTGPTLKGRKIGVLLGEGLDPALLAPKRGGVKDARGKLTPVDFALSAAPSVLFDAVVILGRLPDVAAAVDWVRNAFGHLKAIGYGEDVEPLLKRSLVHADEAVVALSDAHAVGRYLTAAKRGRLWSREPLVRDPG